jgi:hypothetical protein
MATTDSPLKRLVTTFIDDFATWLLESEVDSVTPHNIELYAKPDPVRADQIFTVKLADGRTIVLHIEFQGRRSEIPMPLRELDSLSRLALKFQDMELYSVVFYVGKGAGIDDTGIHEITNPSGGITLTWQYKVIHLWKMKAEELVEMDKPSLLGLIGQTQITKPETLLPKVVEMVKTLPKFEMQKRLLAEMLLLLEDKEVLNMLERLIENEDLLLDTPMMRRLRAQGELNKSRDNILKVVDLRFQPELSLRQEFEQQLEFIVNETVLDMLLMTAVQCQTIMEFQTLLDSANKTH